MPFWVMFIGAMLLVGGVWFMAWLNRPITAPRGVSKLASMYVKQDCGTCSGTGVFDITNPRKALSIYDQMRMANQVDCDCCQGIGFHHIVPGTRRVCKRK